MTNHTKGPWEDNGEGLIYGQVSGDTDEAPFIADVCRNAGEYLEQEKANACLICAAPELLTALEQLLSCDGDLDAMDFKQARAAIKKAKGEQL